MASVIIKRDTLAKINATPITDGQLLFSTDQKNDNNKIYADVGSDRKVIGGRTEVVDTLASWSTTKALSANMGKDLNKNIGNLTTLTTTKKSSVVEAIDELKGVSDEINSNLNRLRISYYYLISDSSTGTKTLSLNRKLSDYDLIGFITTSGYYQRNPSVIPTDLFNQVEIDFPLIATENISRWATYKKDSDTSITINGSPDITGYVVIGIKLSM